MCDVSPTNQVKNLPDFICQPSQVSDRVSNISAKQSSNHERALVEYQSKIKELNTKIESKVAYQCQAAASKLSVLYKSIEDSRISALRTLKNFSSVEQFREVWFLIRCDMDEATVIIEELENDLIVACEHDRMDRINQIMSEYFEIIFESGMCDELKLGAFLDEESRKFNLATIRNYRCYVNLSVNLRFRSAEKLKEYKIEWDKLLMTWRDFLVRQNLLIIRDIVSSEEYRYPNQVVDAKEQTLCELTRLDDKVMEMFGEIVKGLPYNKSKLINFSRSIEDILDSKSKLQNRFTQRAQAHFHMLIDKLEKRLLSMKDFLSKEASCDNEQFMRTFSRYVGQGSDSFETRCEQLLGEFDEEIGRNIANMTQVYSTTMAFINRVCDLWEDNLNNVTAQKEALNTHISSIRNDHQNEIKILEYTIDKSAEKVSQTSDVSSLERLFEKITVNLKKIDEVSDVAFDSYFRTLETYPTTCHDQIQEYTTEALRIIGLQLVRKKARKSLQSAQSNFLEINGKQYLKLNGIPGFFDDGTSVDPAIKRLFCVIVEQAREFVIIHITNHEKKHGEETESLVTKLKLELEKERALRKSLSAPRVKNIRHNFDQRKDELKNFKKAFDSFYSTTQLFEMELTNLEEKLSNDSLGLIKSVEQKVKEECDGQLEQTRSKKLIEAHEKFQKVLFDLENKLPELFKTAISSVEKLTQKMKQNEESFVIFSEAGNYNFGEKSRLYFEFGELKEKTKSVALHSKRMMKQQEGIRMKKMTAVVISYQTHYKHCLLGLYFSEMRSCHLSGVRLKLKCILSQGEKGCLSVNEKLGEIKGIISSIPSCSMSEMPKNSKQVRVSFNDLFLQLKRVINFFNHRCNAISVPHKTSLAEIKQKYDVFGSPDASLTDTVSFTQEILSMTSSKASSAASDYDSEHTEAKDWVINRHEVDKKYIQKRIFCVYGVGANIMDVPNNQWPGIFATLTNTPNSYWLSRSADGLQALKELREKKEKLLVDQEETRIDKNKRKSKKSVGGATTKKSNNWNTLKMVLVPGMKETAAETTKTVLPKIEPKPMGSTLKAVKKERKESSAHWNMKTAMKVTKTADMLSIEKAKKKSLSQYQKKVKIYDFLAMDELDLRSIVFEPKAFFALDERLYKVDQVCESIDSVTEKTKFYLFHLQEDFVISCIIFYRQRHLNIKYPELVQPNMDAAVSSFVNTTQGYLDRVNSACTENIARIKKLLSKIYKMLTDMPKTFFSRILEQSSANFLHFYEEHLELQMKLLGRNKEEKRVLLLKLRPSLEHPQCADELREICDGEERNRISGVATELFNDGMSGMRERRDIFLSTIESAANDLTSVCDTVIQIEDIRKVGSEDNSLEVKKRLRQNQLNSNIIQNESSYKAALFAFSKLNNTRHKLKGCVEDEKNQTIAVFQELFSSVIDEYQQLFDTAMREETDWIYQWEKSLKELRAGPVYEE